MSFGRLPITALIIAFLFQASTSNQALPGPPSTVAPGAGLTVVYASDQFFEGPSWDPVSSKLYFTAFAKDNEQLLRLDGPNKAFVWMDHTKGINGTYFSKTGRLLVAQAFGHTVQSIKIGENGPTDAKVLAAGFEGIPFIQPNDVAESPVTGGIYFSDPNFNGKTHSSVYYLNESGSVRRIIENLKLPNGLEVSNDGTTLFVSDSFEKRIYSYPILADGTVDQGQVKIFFDPATQNTADPDGMCTDALGNVYFAMRGGVWVVSREGKQMGFIAVPEFVSNVTFGGADGQTLFLTCDKKVYSLAMRVKGAQFK